MNNIFYQTKNYFLRITNIYVTNKSISFKSTLSYISIQQVERTIEIDIQQHNEGYILYVKSNGQDLKRYLNKGQAIFLNKILENGIDNDEAKDALINIVKGEFNKEGYLETGEYTFKEGRWEKTKPNGRLELETNGSQEEKEKLTNIFEKLFLESKTLVFEKLKNTINKLKTSKKEKQEMIKKLELGNTLFNYKVNFSPDNNFRIEAIALANYDRVIIKHPNIDITKIIDDKGFQTFIKNTFIHELTHISGMYLNKSEKMFTEALTIKIQNELCEEIKGENNNSYLSKLLYRGKQEKEILKEDILTNNNENFNINDNKSKLTIKEIKNMKVYLKEILENYEIMGYDVFGGKRDTSNKIYIDEYFDSNMIKDKNIDEVLKMELEMKKDGLSMNNLNFLILKKFKENGTSNNRIKIITEELSKDKQISNHYDSYLKKEIKKIKTVKQFKVNLNDIDSIEQASKIKTFLKNLIPDFFKSKKQKIIYNEEIKYDSYEVME